MHRNASLLSARVNRFDALRSAKWAHFQMDLAANVDDDGKARIRTNWDRWLSRYNSVADRMWATYCRAMKESK